MQLKTKFGLALIALGIGIFVAWDLWTHSRNLTPVNKTVSLVADRTITSDFWLNFDGLYLIEIEAEKNLPPDMLHCLLGVDADAAKCEEFQPVLEANWVLSSGGRELSRGSTRQQYTAPAEGEKVLREIGEFHGQSGRGYTLHVNFTRNGEALAPAHPRLKVSVASIAYTDIQSAGVLVFSTSFICVLFGVVLLAIACFARPAGSGSSGQKSREGPRDANHNVR